MVKNISFMIGEGAIEFSYNDNETAYLQLPHTNESVHEINGISSNDWNDEDNEKEREILKQLSEFYFNSFKKPGTAAASAKLGSIIVHIEEVIHKGQTLYVAFDEEDNAYILVDSPYKNYYNKLYLFEKVDDMKGHELFGDDYSESDIIEKAKKLYEKKDNS